MREPRLPLATATVGLCAVPIADPSLALGPQSLDVTKLVLLAAMLLFCVGVAWMLARPATPRATRDREDEGRFLQYTAANIWALDHFCSSIGEVKRAMPELIFVCIDLRNVPALDASSLASLDYAVKRLTHRGIRVAIQGCNARLAMELKRRGLPA